MKLASPERCLLSRDDSLTLARKRSFRVMFRVKPALQLAFLCPNSVLEIDVEVEDSDGGGGDDDGKDDLGSAVPFSLPRGNARRAPGARRKLGPGESRRDERSGEGFTWLERVDENGDDEKEKEEEE